ncbi:disulfide bond formation protein B [Maribius pontilimi]|uniref:Disulfide bond formation protein B n=1 Tax=Palleronia pontilimi TaxID=1964209 RepID=A0A934IC42_9RHOB|nr:disulfide bond formation protein B [Palleronia pontilimi]MBJ3762921.1 disulfide bond formation protein B [Palleronia pontilimi]
MSAKRLMLAAAFGSFALLAGAYLFQALGYAPCKMCLWQRWPHWIAIGLGLLAWFAPTWPVAAAGGLAALTTGGIGVFHTGVERGWWPGPSSCSGGSDLGGLSGTDLLSTDVLDKVVMCDEVSWAFLGLSMASWNAALSFVLAAIWIAAAVRSVRASHGVPGYF